MNCMDRSSADGGSGDKDKSEDQPKDLDAVEAEVVKDILPPETQTLAEETQPLSNIDEGGSPSPVSLVSLWSSVTSIGHYGGLASPWWFDAQLCSMSACFVV